MKRDQGPYKKYLMLNAAFITALLAFIGFFNGLVDPYGLFGFVNYPGFNDIKEMKYRTKNSWAWAGIQTILRSDYDTVIIGNSRAHIAMDPSVLSPEYKAYNASNSGLNIENFYSVLHPVLEAKESRVKTVIIGLDFGGERRRNELSDDLFEAKSPFKAVFGLYTLKDSILTVKQNIKERGKEPDYQPNGARIYTKRTDYFQDHERFEANIIRLYKKLYGFPLERAYGWNYLERIVNECNGRGVKLLIYFSPMNAELLEGLAQLGMYADYENWIRTVVRIAYGDSKNPSDDRNVQVWDFGGYNTITTESLQGIGENAGVKWYYDFSHFNRKVGKMIFSIMLKHPQRDPEIPGDFGILLSPDNTEKRIKEMRLKRKLYNGGRQETN